MLLLSSRRSSITIAKRFLNSLNKVLINPNPKPHRSSSLVSSIFPSSRFCSNSSSGSSQNSILKETQIEFRSISRRNSSDEPADEFSSTNLPLTHESVIYILKKLQKNPKKALEFFERNQAGDGFKFNRTAYNLMIRIVGRRDYVAEFWRIVEEMKENGLGIDVETYRHVLGAFLEEKMMKDASVWREMMDLKVMENSSRVDLNAMLTILNGSDWDEVMEMKLGNLRIDFDEENVIQVLKSMHGEPFKALAFFHWIDRKSRFNHNSVTYNAVLKCLGCKESVAKFWDVIKEMKSRGYELDIDSYTKISRRFQKCKMLNDVVDLYEFMTRSPYKPSAQECGVILRQLAVSDDIDLVFRLAKIYEDGGFSCSKVIYDGIHRALTNAGRFEEAGEIMGRMREAGYLPDNVTYSQLVFGMCKAGRLVDACKVFDEMKDDGCVPDVMTWTILIRGLFQAGEANKALSCFAKMVEKNCSVDADLMEVVVKGLCDKHRDQDAYKLLMEMVDSFKLKPFQATYKYLICGLLGKRKFGEALDLLKSMKKHEFPPFMEPFASFIAKNGTVEDAFELLNSLSGTGLPSASVYLRVLEAFCNERRYAEAQDLLQKFPHHAKSHAGIARLLRSLRPSESKTTSLANSSDRISSSGKRRSIDGHVRRSM